VREKRIEAAAGKEMARMGCFLSPFRTSSRGCHLQYLLALLLFLSGAVMVTSYSYLDVVEHAVSGVYCGGGVYVRNTRISAMSSAPLCADGWDDNDAKVVCREWGYEGGEAATFPLSSPLPQTTQADCAGGEEELGECPLLYSTQCNTGAMAVARCLCQTEDTIDDVRLVGGGSSCQGRLEVNVNGEWGQVCDDGFSRREAAVACRQLLFSGYHAYSSGRAPFGSSGLDFRADDMSCSAAMSTLSECEFSSDHNCDEDEVVSLICSECNEPPSSVAQSVRLVGGRTQCEGNVEVYIAGSWGFVCEDKGFSTAAADVVCKQLGYEGMGKIPSDTIYGSDPTEWWTLNSLDYVIDGVECTGAEQSLQECSFSLPSSCSTPARVACTGAEECAGNYANFYFPTFAIPILVVLGVGVLITARVIWVVRKKRRNRR